MDTKSYIFMGLRKGTGSESGKYVETCGSFTNGLIDGRYNTASATCIARGWMRREKLDGFELYKGGSFSHPRNLIKRYTE